MKTALQTLLQQNRDRLASINTLEDVIYKRLNRKGDITSLKASLKLEEELYALDVSAIKTLREAIKV